MSCYSSYFHTLLLKMLFIFINILKVGMLNFYQAFIKQKFAIRIRGQMRPDKWRLFHISIQTPWTSHRRPYRCSAWESPYFTTCATFKCFFVTANTPAKWKERKNTFSKEFREHLKKDCGCPSMYVFQFYHRFGV